MNATVALRVLWKEYRALRSLWLAMLVLTVAISALVAWQLRDSPADLPMGVLAAALALPAFYALGCGAVAFAGERESGTYDFQRALPVTAAEVLAGKSAFALLSTPPLVGLTFLIGLALCGGRTPDNPQFAGLVAAWCFAAVELYVWAVLFSLVLTQPIPAALLGSAAASTAVFCLVTRCWLDMFAFQACLDYLPARVLIAVAVAGMDVWLGLRWLREGRSWEVIRARWVGPDAGRGEFPPLGVWRRMAPSGRLAWEQARQSGWGFSIVAAVVLGSLGLAIALAVHIAIEGWNTHGHTPLLLDDMAGGLVVALVVLAPVSGAMAFLGDQRRRSYRFLAARGLSAGQLWWNRQAVALLAAIALAVALATLSAATRTGPGRDWEAIIMVLISLGYVALAYSAGQLAAMFSRSSILAVCVAMGLTAGLSMWSAAMIGLDIGWWWSAAPIPVVLLVASRLRASHWLVDRDGWRGWLPAGACLAACPAVLVPAVILYRIYEIPWTTPSFVAEADRLANDPEARATADLYLRAADVYLPLRSRERQGGAAVPGMPGGEPPANAQAVGSDPLPAWLKRNEETIALLTEAGRHPRCDVRRLEASPRWAERQANLNMLLFTSASVLQADGRLDEAFEKYVTALRSARHWGSGGWMNRSYLEIGIYNELPNWSAAPGQTPARLAAAIKRLRAEFRQPPPLGQGIVEKYVRARELLDDPWGVIARRQLAPNSQEYQMARGMPWMPWERARLVRAVNFAAEEEWQQTRQAEADLAAGRRPTIQAYFGFAGESERRYNTTPWLWACYQRGAWYDVEWPLRTETHRRAVLLQLALAAWRLEHGELPDTLDPLVGTYLERMPLVPATGEPFRWFPQGIPESSPPLDAKLRADLGLPAPGQPALLAYGTIQYLGPNGEVLTMDLGRRVLPADLPEFYRAPWFRGPWFVVPAPSEP